MGTRAGLLLGVIVLLMAGVGAQAQEPTEPEVEITDVVFEEPIVPLAAPGQAEMDVRVGCDAQETPQTVTQAIMSTEQAPEWANFIVSPALLQWQTEAGDCPSTEPPFEGTAQAFVSLTGEAPAYEETTFPITAMVEKVPPVGDQNRTYGPYEANVTLTPGYYHQHDVQVDEKIQEVAHNATARFEGTVDNLANHETSYTFSTNETDLETNVSLEPAELVLEAGQTGTFAVEVALANPEADGGQPVAIRLSLEGETTHPEGGDGGSSEVPLLAEFQQPPSETDNMPAPSLAASMALVALAAFLARDRFQRRG